MVAIETNKQKQTVSLGVQAEGVILVGDQNDDGKRFILLNKEDFKVIAEDDEVIVDSLQTKHGFVTTNGTNIKLYSKEGENRKWEIMSGVKYELYELTGKNTKTKVMELNEAPNGYIYMMKELVFYEDQNKNLVSYFIAMNMKCGNEIKCDMLRKVGYRLYALKPKDHSCVHVYDDRLNQTESIHFDEPVKNIINYNIFALVVTETKVYYMTRAKCILLCASAEKINTAALCGNNGVINAVIALENKKVIRAQIILKGHHFKATTIKSVPCTLCKQSNNEKMVFCGDCGMPVHMSCFHSYHGEVIHNHFPCLHSEK